MATLRRALTAATVAAVVGTTMLVATRDDVGTVFLALDRGSGGAGRAALDALPLTLALLAPGLVGFALLAVLTRALYAAHRPWDAAAGTVLGWAVAGLLPLIVAPLLIPPAPTIRELLGALAGSSSAGMLLAAAVLLARTRRVWGQESLGGVARAALAAMVGGMVVVALRAVLPWPGADPGWFIALVAGTLTGLLTLALVAAARRLLAPASAALVRDRLPGAGDRRRTEPVGTGGPR